MHTRRSFHLAGAALIGILALGHLTLAAAQTDTLARIQQNKKIRIAIDPNVPPWSHKNEKLDMTGSEYETAQMLAKDLGVEMEMVVTNGASRIPLLLTDKADLVVSAMTITPERQKVIDFSAPYSGTTTAVSGPKSAQVKTMSDLVGKRVAVARGTAMDTDLTALAPKGVDIIRFEDESTTMTAVISGQAEFVAQSVTLNATINKRDPSKQIEPKVVMRNSLHGMGLRKGDKRLKDWVDQWIKTNMADGKLVAVFKKHQGIDLPAAVIEASQRPTPSVN